MIIISEIPRQMRFICADNKLTAHFVEKIRHITIAVQQYYRKLKHIEHYNANMDVLNTIDQSLEPYNSAGKIIHCSKNWDSILLKKMVLNANVFYSTSHSR